MLRVGRPINGISINGLEYALNEDGELLLFKTEMEAEDFLLSVGVEEDELDYFVIEEDE